MSKFTPTNRSNSCQACGDTSGKCRTTDSKIILCMDAIDRHSTPSGWKFLGTTNGGYFAGKLAPIENDTDGLTDLERRVERDRLKAKRDADRAIEDEQRIGKLPTLADRHKLLSNKPHSLTSSQNADLLHRGLTQVEINDCLSRGYLWAEYGGYGIAAIDPVTGLIVGGQKANDGRGETYHDRDGSERITPKYSWLLPGAAKLQETSELPLAVWLSPNIDRTKPIDIRLCEGFLQPLIAGIKAWRSDHQVVYIGAAGGNFQAVSLARVLDALPESSLTLYPDAGAIVNPSVMHSYQNLANIVGPDRLNVAWWQQWTKASPDIDELPEGQKTVTLPWKEFYSISMGTDASGLKGWIENRKFTADDTIDVEYFDYRTVAMGELLGIRSGLGSGKTHWLVEKIISQCSKAIVIVPTTVLGENLTERIQNSGATAASIGALTVQGDSNATELLRSSTDAIALCPDSLLALSPESSRGAVLIIDEAMEVALAIWFRDTHIKSIRKPAIDRLSKLMENADAVILLDGNLTDNIFNWYASLCPSKFQAKVLNTRSKKMKVRLHVSDGKSHGGDFTASIDRTKKFCMATDSRADAHEVAQYPFSSETCRVGAIDKSGNLVDSWAQLGQKNPIKFHELIKPNSMAWTPALGSGFDLSGVDGYYDRFYGFFKGVVNVNSINQSIARNRDFDLVRDLWVDSHGLPSSWPIDSDATSTGSVVEQMYRVRSEIIGLLTGGEISIMEASQRLLDSMAADTTELAIINEVAASMFERRNLRACLTYSLLESGHDIDIVVLGQQDKGFKGELTQSKRERVLSIASQIIAAPTIDKREADRLTVAKRIAPGQNEQLARFKLHERLPGISKSALWNSTKQIQKGKGINAISESEAAVFVHNLPSLAKKAERFWLLMNLPVAKKQGQKIWQKFLDEGWIDFSKLNIQYVSTKKIHGVLSKFIPDLFPVLGNIDDAEIQSSSEFQPIDRKPHSYIIKKTSVALMVRDLTTGRGGLEALKGRSHFRYLKDVLSPYGLALSEDDGGNIIIDRPCLNPESELGQVYAAVNARFSPRLEEAPHVWEVPTLREPTVPAAAIDLSGEWADFITSERTKGHTPDVIEVLRGRMEYVPGEVWAAIMAEELAVWDNSEFEVAA